MVSFLIEEKKHTLGYFTTKCGKELLVVYLEARSSISLLRFSVIEEVIHKYINGSHISYQPFKISKPLAFITLPEHQHVVNIYLPE